MERILYEVKRVVVGQDHFLERVLVAILAQGHLLVEGVPGLAKTLTVKTLARTIRGTFPVEPGGRGASAADAVSDGPASVAPRRSLNNDGPSGRAGGAGVASAPASTVGSGTPRSSTVHLSARSAAPLRVQRGCCPA